MEQNWVLLTRVPTLIMRGALVSRLGEAHIEVYVPERDMITQVSDMPNLSLEGYTALFEGYSVYVQRSDLAKAQEVLKDFEKLAWSQANESPGIDHLSKFYLAALTTWIFPVALHLVALYHFGKALRQRPLRISWGRMVFAWLVFLCSAYWALYIVRDAIRAVISF